MWYRINVYSGGVSVFFLILKTAHFGVIFIMLVDMRFVSVL